MIRMTRQASPSGKSEKNLALELSPLAPRSRVVINRSAYFCVLMLNAWIRRGAVTGRRIR
jgi:hypothetical protein